MKLANHWDLWALGIRRGTWAMLILLIAALAMGGCSRKSNSRTEGALESDAAGIQVYANYDARFDQILERYRLLSITFMNQSPTLLELDAQNDRWILTTRGGSRVEAINSLRMRDPKAWNTLPVRAQEIIEYPRVVLRNTTVTFDVLFPKDVDLRGFHEIEFFSKSLNQTFRGGTLPTDESAHGVN